MMHRHTPLAIVALAAIAALGAGTARAAETVHGTARVIDGETLEVGGIRLRLRGIDAPEAGQQCRVRGRTYDCGRVAATALMDLTAGANVECNVEKAETDPPVALCRVDGYDLSEGMAYTGWALALDPGGAYRRHQARAKAGGHGLWRGKFVEPWRWRAGTRLPPP